MAEEPKINAAELLAKISDAELCEEIEKRGLEKKFVAYEEVEVEVDHSRPELADVECLHKALGYWQLRQTDDALFYLEEALGRKWNGLSQLAARIK